MNVEKLMDGITINLGHASRVDFEKLVGVNE